MNDRNLGRFWIDINLIKNNPDEVAKLFAYLKIVPVRCEMMHHLDAFEYIALCPEFREVPYSEIPPDYEIEIFRSGGGKEVEITGYAVRKKDFPQVVR